MTLQNSLAFLLIKNEFLTETTICEAITRAKAEKISLIHYLVKYSLMSPQKLAQLIGQTFGMTIFDLDTFDKSRILIHVVNEKLIRKHYVLPLWQEDQQLYLAVADPTNQTVIDEIKFFTGLNIQCVLVEADKLHTLIEEILTLKHHEQFNHSIQKINHEIASSNDENIHSATTHDDAPIIRYVNKILIDATQKNSSDIHFEPYEKKFQIRFRIDGILHIIANLPTYIANRICARLKIIAGLDIAERRLPQDGRFKFTTPQNNSIDFRISTCPTIHGEKIVVRILDANKNLLDIDRLGLNEKQKNIFCHAIKKSHGMILVTGPTGSGKTITLYNALNILNTSAVNICTVENPVEINLTGINQININPKAGLNFANALRTFLRQDPDIIMVGEIRDPETAEIGIKAAQTGHLVLSTLHTNSAIETFTRLAHLGISNYNFATAVKLIMAQRLARRLCSHCKTQTHIPERILLSEGFSEHDLINLEIFQPVGCQRCTNGYNGRVGLFELLPISESIEQLIMQNKNPSSLAQQMKKEGHYTLRESGLEKIKMGLTSLTEINRILNV